MPETQPEDEMIRCPFCGRMTSSSANFCYWCARELKARPEHPAEGPAPRKVNWLVLGVIVGAILFLVIYTLLH